MQNFEQITKCSNKFNIGETRITYPQENVMDESTLMDLQKSDPQDEVVERQSNESEGDEPKTPDNLNETSDIKSSKNVQVVDSELSTSSSLDSNSLVLWRQPGLTILYCLQELFFHTRKMFLRITYFRKIIYITILFLVIIRCLNSSCILRHPTVLRVQKKLLWSLYWFSLGILSSVGLGSGVHTFALYLGPYIASVTVAATDCGYLNFEDISNQGTIECPTDPDPKWAATLWNIMCKVRLESYMWGLGTAVGELPPYFMGRAARISGEERTDALREVEALDRRKDGCPESLSFLDKVKLCVRDLVVKAGFWGILACASIPNPFFDLAGITCGSFLIPFWTFFGATVIGKAIIKTTIQQVFVILSFNKYFLTRVFEVLSKIPLVGQRLETYFTEYIAKQKEKFSQDRIDYNTNTGWFSMAYHGFVICTFLHCLISIVNSLAQNHYKRLKREEEGKNK